MIKQHPNILIDEWGARFNNWAFHISVMAGLAGLAGLTVEILFMLFSHNGLKINEYKVYWLANGFSTNW